MGMIAYLRELQPGDVPHLDDAAGVSKLFARGDAATLSLEKSWHGLHYLLTAAGDAPELGFLFLGGTEVGVRLSYGRPRFLDAGFVRRLDAALAAITEDKLWAGFDAARFEAEGVYPMIWDEPADELREEHVWYFNALQTFVRRVAAAGGQVAVVIS